MYKRFLAILAVVTTVFAFGVGSAMADKPEEAGKKSPHPACEKDNPPAGCADNGHPDDPDGDDGDEGGTPNPQDLCDASRGLDANLAPVADACDAVIAALTGSGDDGEAGASPLQPLCDGIRGADANLAPAADGCDELVRNLPAPPA